MRLVSLTLRLREKQVVALAAGGTRADNEGGRWRRQAREMALARLAELRAEGVQRAEVRVFVYAETRQVDDLSFDYVDLDTTWPSEAWEARAA